MPEDTVDVKDAAGSSPAGSESVTATVFETIEMQDMTGAEHDTWLSTGNLPERFTPKPQDGTEQKKPSPAAEAAKAREKEEAKAKAAAKTADAENGKNEESVEALHDADDRNAQKPPDAKPEKGAHAERRIIQLSDQIQDSLKEKKRILAEIADLEKTRAELAADSAPAKAVTDAKTLKRPRLDDYPTTTEFDEATDAYDNEKEIANAKRLRDAVDEAIKKDREERSKLEQTSRIQEQNRQILDSWNKRLDASTKRHADFTDVALTGKIPMNDTADAYILKSELGAELLYALGSDLDEAVRISALDPHETMEALVELKLTLAETLKVPADKKPIIPRAPRPPTDVGAKKTVPDDEADYALDQGDFVSYQKTMNAREFKR